ncbi:MAG TPA: hypothetical protein VGD59_06525 [Acidisarcina sp.]
MIDETGSLPQIVSSSTLLMHNRTTGAPATGKLSDMTGVSYTSHEFYRLTTGGPIISLSKTA